MLTVKKKLLCKKAKRGEVVTAREGVSSELNLTFSGRKEGAGVVFGGSHTTHGHRREESLGRNGEGGGGGPLFQTGRGMALERTGGTRADEV